MNKKSDNKYYGVDELHRKVCKYLDDNGFRLISCSSSGGDKIEIWERGE